MERTHYIRDVVNNNNYILRYDKLVDWDKVIDLIIQGDNAEQTSDNCKRLIKRMFIAEETAEHDKYLNQALTTIPESII